MQALVLERVGLQGLCELVAADREGIPGGSPRQSAAHTASERSHVLGRYLHGLLYSRAPRPNSDPACHNKAVSAIFCWLGKWHDLMAHVTATGYLSF